MCVEPRTQLRRTRERLSKIIDGAKGRSWHSPHQHHQHQLFWQLRCLRNDLHKRNVSAFDAHRYFRNIPEKWAERETSAAAQHRCEEGRQASKRRGMLSSLKFTQRRSLSSHRLEISLSSTLFFLTFLSNFFFQTYFSSWSKQTCFK